MHPFDKFEEMFGQVRSKNGHKGFIDFLVTILPAVLPLIIECFNPTPAALRRPLFNRARLAAAIRRHDPSVTFAEAFEAADDCFQVAKEATDEELQEFVKCCR